MGTLVISIRFLDEAYHGRGANLESEWPPSPLRVFQAMTVASARRGDSSCWPALEWLEQLSAPVILAPRSTVGHPIRLAVPNNDLDIVAADWAKGRESKKQPNELKTMKPVARRWLKDTAVHYVWPCDVPQEHLRALNDAARHVVALGWGIDLAVGEARSVDDADLKLLSGVRWTPVGAVHDGGLRVPVDGTLRDVRRRHAQFLRRLDGGEFTQPGQLEVFERVDYRRSSDRPAAAIAGFSLLRTDASALRAFDAATRGVAVAGMMRHAVKRAAEAAGWSSERVQQFVLGHGERMGQPHSAVGHVRFKYLPLPSLERREGGRVVGAIRRVILTSEADEASAEVRWATRALSGSELLDEGGGESAALLAALPATDDGLRVYCRRSSTWTTVSPVVLPGFDDPGHFRRRLKRGVGSEEQRRLLSKLDSRIDMLLRKSLLQAGFGAELAESAAIEWRDVAYLPGADLASRFRVPAHLKDRPRFHVRLEWRDPDGGPLEIDGPICVGGGRFFGVGLFVAV